MGDALPEDGQTRLKGADAVVVGLGPCDLGVKALGLARQAGVFRLQAAKEVGLSHRRLG